MDFIWKIELSLLRFVMTFLTACRWAVDNWPWPAQCFYIYQTWQYSQIIWCWITCAIDMALLNHTWSTRMKLCNGFGWYFVPFWSVLIHCSAWFTWSWNRNLLSDILLIFQPMCAWCDLLSASFVWNISCCGS